jgi:hypothetical protein
MVQFKIIKAWGVENNSQENQTGGYYPWLNPYMLFALKGKLFDFDSTDFKDNLKKMIKWNYQYKIYKLLFEDMENQRKYMAKVDWRRPGYPVTVFNWTR